jgi:uncharacterized protein YggT (Ycf19 family)
MWWIIIAFLVGVVAFAVLVTFVPNVADVVTEFLANVCEKLEKFFKKLKKKLRNAYGRTDIINE